MSDPIGPVPPAPTPTKPEPGRDGAVESSPTARRASALRRATRWAPLAGTAVLAFVAGAAAEYLTAPDYTETAEYAAVQDRVADREASLDERERDLEKFEDDVAAIDDRTADLDRREMDLDTREAGLDARSDDLDTRSGELDAREEAVTSAEVAVEAGTIPGDGIFLVGTDIQPGAYRGNAAGNSDCYWARLSGTSGDFDDLTANGIPQGPTVVTISSSDVAFETTSCGEWHLIP
jgi:hypothetical protein